MFDPAGNVIKSVALGGVDLIDIYFDPITGNFSWVVGLVKLSGIYTGLILTVEAVKV